MTALYAIRQKDFLGVVYTHGYTLARSAEEASERAREVNPDAFAEPTSGEAEQERLFNDLVEAGNERAARPCL